MVTITKKGELNSDKEYAGRCVYCRTEFTFKKSEARSDSTDLRNGTSLVIKCPLPGCNSDVWVDT